MKANDILTIGIDYRLVRGGVAAVENVYSTFYEPFNHVTTVVSTGQVRKALVAVRALVQFLWWMIAHPEVKIVHVHGSSDVSFWRKRVFIYFAKWFGKRVVYHMHGGHFAEFSQQHHKAVANVLKHCDCVIALSEYWKGFFAADFDYNKTVVIKNVIAEPYPEKLKHDVFTMLFLGLLGHNKGIFNLLDVITEHKNEFESKLRLFIGGNGEVDKVKRIISEQKLDHIVSFEGWVSGDKKRRLLNLSDAYILPSYHEGLPISILEAMSYSLPIISTRVGGIPEIVKDGENGCLIEAGDKKAIYASIKKLMESPELCKSMGEKSKEKVQEHLPDYVAQQLRALYDQLLTQ